MANKTFQTVEAKPGEWVVFTTDDEITLAVCQSKAEAIAKCAELRTWTSQGAENLGRNNPSMPNPYSVGTADWRRFDHGVAVAKFQAS